MSKAKAWTVHLLWGLLILVDVILNLLLALFTPSYFLAQAWKETLSARAGRMREKGQPIWGWTADAIDSAALFFGQKDHCATQVKREAQYGGVWSAWRMEAPNAPPPPPTQGGVQP